MDLVRNIASGKFFVVVDDSGGPDILVITPEGRMRSLERHLFEPMELTEAAGQLTKMQIDLYSAYLDE